MGCIFEYGSLDCRALSGGSESASDQTENAWLAGIAPSRGYFSSWNASPPGWSMRNIQVLPLPPGRCDVNSSSLPSGDQRGLVLSVLGDVKRRASPPAVGTTQTSRWYLLSFSSAVCTWKAICDPSGDIAGADSTESRYQSASVNARLA